MVFPIGIPKLEKYQQLKYVVEVRISSVEQSYFVAYSACTVLHNSDDLLVFSSASVDEQSEEEIGGQ